jgi:hypothetical protein
MSPETIDAMLTAGASAEVIAAAWKAELAAQQKQLEDKRAKDAERQRRHRMSQDVTRCHSDIADVTGSSVTPALDKEIPQTPKETKPTPTPPYSPPTSPKRGVRLADNFEPPEDWIAWAMKKRGWGRDEAIDECECFIRYWQAKPGREACKLDWPKTWQNWAVNSRRQATDARVGAWDVMP